MTNMTSAYTKITGKTKAMSDATTLLVDSTKNIEIAQPALARAAVAKNL
jgi:hypothetical protein